MEIFLINAIIGGIAIAIISGILGSFVLWRNMSYFGDALSHSSLLGITVAILSGVNFTLAILFISIIFAIAFNQNSSRYANDTILGILSYTALSLAIILTSYSKIKIDLMAYLFGDILAINNSDIWQLIFCAIFIITCLYLSWSKLILLSISEELLQTERVNIKQVKLGFALILAIFVAVAFKIVGILLITAMLIIPAAGALAISRQPLQMILFSIVIGCISVIGGLTASLIFDFPTGPSIIITSFCCLIITNIANYLSSKFN